MNNRALAKAIGQLRQDCKTPGSRKIFDSLMQGSPKWREWVQKSANRQDAVNLPFAARQLEFVYEQAVEVEFPALVFAQESDPLVKWDTSVPRGAKTFVWYYSEGAGDAEFFAALGADGLPSPSRMGAEQHGKVEGFGSEIKVTIPELEGAAFAGQNLDTMLGEDNKRGHAERLNDTAAWGREDIGIPGFLNNPQIAQQVAALKGGGPSTAWADATGGEIIADVLGLVNGIQVDSRELYRPNVVALPARYLRILTQTRISEGDATDSGTTTLMEFLQKAFQADGQPIRFRTCEDLLAENSLGWLDTDGMIAFNDDPRFVSLVVPIWYDLEAVQQVGFALLTPTRSSMGGIKLPYPITVAMMTGLGS